MPTHQGIAAPDVCRWKRPLQGLTVLCAWALCGLAMAGAAPPATTYYRVVPVTPEVYVSGIDINARGQVAYTDYSNYHAWFYDGSTVQQIGSNFAVAQALNDRGQVAGSNSGQAFRWSAATGPEYIDPSPQPNSHAFAINEKGHVAGSAIVGTDFPTGFLWTPQSGLRSIGTLGGRSDAKALNESGVVVGYSGTNPDGTNSASLAIRWTAAEGMRAISAYPSPASQANDVNEAGHIVGAAAFSPKGLERAFLWTPGAGLRDLGTGTGTGSDATRINDQGLVIGGLTGGAGYARRGFAWTKEHGMVEIGAGSSNSTANDVNAHGQVVGQIDSRAYVWTRAGGIVDLNTRLSNAPPDLVLQEARVISDNGSIAVMSNAGLVLLVPLAPAANAAPVLGPVKVGGTASVDSLLSFSASFTDADKGDTHRATWSWGDGTTDTGIVSARHGSGTISGQHVYRKPGSYKVTLTLTDSGGKSTKAQRSVTVCGAGRTL